MSKAHQRENGLNDIGQTTPDMSAYGAASPQTHHIDQSRPPNNLSGFHPPSNKSPPGSSSSQISKASLHHQERSQSSRRLRQGNNETMNGNRRGRQKPIRPRNVHQQQHQHGQTPIGQHQHGQTPTGQHPQYFPPQNQSPGGRTDVPSADGNPMIHQHRQNYTSHHSQHQPAQINAPFGSRNPETGAGQSPDIQPNYVSASKSQSSSSTQRRPAYLLHRELVIGKGSYGQVCIASRGDSEGHTSGGRGKRKKYACKCVVLRNDAKYIAKLQEEVNVLRELRGHDNVIRLYDVFCVDNELFIITELGRGGDLFHLLTTHPKHGVTEAYAAKTVAQMLSAVAFLHSRNICHRDLKLENWVLESGKDVWSPLKLIDFGLSTHFTPGHRLSRVVGSSYYVAPEVLKKSYSEACDLWSLGVIVYMLLSGAPPFYGKNDEAIKASIVQGEYTFPSELFRDVTHEAMGFVSSLLSYNIEYRFTANQALDHIWLKSNCEPELLNGAKNGANGNDMHSSYISETDAMQI